MATIDDLYARFVPNFDPLAGGGPADETPLLTPALLAELRAQLASEPALTLALARRALDATITLTDLHAFLDQMAATFNQPQAAIDSIDALGGGPAPLPPAFTFAGFEATPEFRIDPGDHRYEGWTDWTGYGINIGAAILKRVVWSGRAAFRWAEDHASHFHYPLTPNATVGLFSDFGTGQAHARYIAKFLAAAAPEVAIHLGDVYYAGKSGEVARNFVQPLTALCATSELFTLAGNHDYYSGGHAFFDTMDARRGTPAQNHRQQGSYFCLDSPKFRIIGIDVEYHQGERLIESRLQDWLAAAVLEGKAADKRIILLTSDEPYHVNSASTKALLGDITDGLPADAIDLWFWGNTHYCALFGPSKNLRSQFYGSCIGHGGYPYERLTVRSQPDDAAPYLWAEVEPRFPTWTQTRQDRGNNGFVLMKLDDVNQKVTLEYRDWTNALRTTAEFEVRNGAWVHAFVRPLPRPPCR